MRYSIPHMVLSVMAAVLIALPPGYVCAQTAQGRDIIIRAMRDELKRNMDGLVLENMARPFFISYAIHDVKAIEISGCLGAIVSSEEWTTRSSAVRPSSP